MSGATASRPPEPGIAAHPGGPAFRSSFVWPLLAASLLAVPAAAGVVRGTLRLPGVAASAAGSPGGGTRAARRLAESVVYLEKVPEAVEQRLTRRRSWFFLLPAQPRILRIVQMNREFKPRFAAVAVGTNVEFRNLDRFYHNAFSVSAAKRFDLGKYPPGRIDTVVFDRAGLVNLHCDIHPDMVGYVVVTPNHAFTRPDSLGRFKLPSLPPGSYTVRAVHPMIGEVRQRVEMPKRGNATIELSFQR